MVASAQLLQIYVCVLTLASYDKIKIGAKRFTDELQLSTDNYHTVSNGVTCKLLKVNIALYRTHERRGDLFFVSFSDLPYPFDDLVRFVVLV